MTTQWKAIPCSQCAGSGLVSAYTFGGDDFTGAADCLSCVDGTVFVSPRNRLALYPGGPFMGSLPRGATA